MDFADKIRDLAAHIPTQLKHISTEEATKNALVMPFLTALGYNVFDPMEVTPELAADVGVKKGEKVDYAILQDEKPIMLFECKACSVNLDQVHASQLYRYFSVTEAHVGVLTNGIIYRFFSDLESPNKMDSRAFLEINLLSLDELSLAELKKFTKAGFQLDTIMANAVELKYTREIKRLIGNELNQPSEEFSRFFASKVYSGRMTQSTREQFLEITKKAFQQFISERISDRLKSALEHEEASVSTSESEDTHDDGVTEVSVTTTEEEVHGFYIVQAILTQVIDPARVIIRDQKTHCSILLDNTNRKPICRLWFNSPQKRVGLFDAEKKETKVPIDSLADIYKLADHLKAAVARYDAPRDSAQSETES
jgi:predicted type IV restriction endonuclease